MHKTDTYGLYECVTKTELDKRYKYWAKLLHPDHGGSEEEMKALNQLRDECVKKLAAKEYEASEADGSSELSLMLDRILAYLNEACPTAAADVMCGSVLEVILHGGVPFGAVLELEEKIREIAALKLPVRVRYWGKRKNRPYTIYTSGAITFVDTSGDVENTYAHYLEETRDPESALYQTYRAYACSGTYGEKWYDAHWCSSKKHGYIMHQSKEFTLKDFYQSIKKVGG